jgi:hypothetical protein
VNRPNPLDDARTLLVIARLLLRTRRRLALNGVQPAGPAARRLVPLGQALAAAVEAAEQASPGDERVRALAEVARLGENLAAQIDPNWEGIEGLVSEAIAGIRGDRARRPGG